MSRSFRHTPITGIAWSEKQDKQTANRRLRFYVRVALRRGNDLMLTVIRMADTCAST